MLDQLEHFLDHGAHTLTHAARHILVRTHTIMRTCFHLDRAQGRRRCTSRWHTATRPASSCCTATARGWSLFSSRASRPCTTQCYTPTAQNRPRLASRSCTGLARTCRPRTCKIRTSSSSRGTARTTRRRSSCASRSHVASSGRHALARDGAAAPALQGQRPGGFLRRQARAQSAVPARMMPVMHAHGLCAMQAGTANKTRIHYDTSLYVLTKTPSLQLTAVNWA